MLALVAEHVQLLGIEEDAALDVHDEGIIGPAVPKARDHIEELAAPLVALAMLDMLLEPEVPGGLRVRGGDEIQPARPPLRWSSEANLRATW